MQPHKKLNEISENSTLDYSFLFSKLEQLNKENSRYKKAFEQIEEVALKVSGGNLSARITQPDEFGKLSQTLSSVNRAYDYADSFIRESTAAQNAALKNQDQFRKEQLQELKDYFEKQIVYILK